MISTEDKEWAQSMIDRFAEKTGYRKDEILRRISLDSIAGVRKAYAKLPFETFVTDLSKFAAKQMPRTNLKEIRTARGLTQQELAERSGVKLRNIQMYEQRGNDINKAQAIALYRMARVLDCSVEELLENPSF